MVTACPVKWSALVAGHLLDSGLWSVLCVALDGPFTSHDASLARSPLACVET